MANSLSSPQKNNQIIDISHRLVTIILLSPTTLLITTITYDRKVSKGFLFPKTHSGGK